jgi:hypothetical protein
VVASDLERVHAQNVTVSHGKVRILLTHSALSTSSGLKGDEDRESGTRPSTML